MTVPACLTAPMIASGRPIKLESSNIAADTSPSTGHTVILAPGIVAGDLVVVAFAVPQSDTSTWPGGWTKIYDQEHTGSGKIRTVIYCVRATGPMTSISVTTSGSTNCVWAGWRISGAANPASRLPEVSTKVEGTSASPDAGNLAPTGGAKRYLWLAIEVARLGSNTATAYPSGYSDTGTLASGSPTVWCALGKASKLAQAASEDAGAFTIVSSTDWQAVTVAVHPE